MNGETADTSRMSGASEQPPAAERPENPGRRLSTGRNCPSCGGSQAVPLAQYSTDEWTIVRCAACDFVYLDNAPSYDRLEDEFAWEKTMVSEAQRRQDARSPLLAWLDRRTRLRLTKFPIFERRILLRTFAPGRVLDVGCGTAFTIPDPFVPFGIEISAHLAPLAHARMAARGGRVVHAPALVALAQFPDRYFSGVLLRGMLEHEKDPKPLLHQVSRVLSDRGAVYLKTPNFGGLNRRVMGRDWCGFRYPDHVNYFTLASLTGMVEDCGFTLKLINRYRLHFDDSIKAILHKV